MSSNIYLQRICEHCGNEFTARTTVTMYCGDTCAKKAYKIRLRNKKVADSNKETAQLKEQPLKDLQSRQFLSVRETCMLLGISQRTIYRMIERKVLTPGKAGRRTIIARSQIDQIFNHHNE